jgi:CRP-like cAMP-binding protein
VPDFELEARQHDSTKTLRELCTAVEFQNDPPRLYYYINILKLVRTYEANESFGELALITNKRRKAKLECQTDCHFAVLSKADYREAQLKA